MADALYPATSEATIGADGRERKLTDAKYVSRLLQYVHESAQGRTVAELIVAQMDALAAKLEALNDVASKGVHATVSDFEVDHCVIETYLTLGGILRLADDRAD